ncbi:hypothetical protein N566_16630 [Streptomycetaceae bacterium MP113-05]|nr:hypothetical protein N566_16630 [Streptomycetaceae bacterium MP113-05]
MRRGFQIEAVLALGLGMFALLSSALTLLPGEPLLLGRLVGGVQFVPVFLLAPLAAVRGVGLFSTGLRGGGGLKRQAFRCLPAAVQIGIAGCFLAGLVLSASGILAETGLHPAGSEGGRYYAFRSEVTGRERFEVSKEKYDELRKQGGRSTHAYIGLLGIGAGSMTLIVGQLHPPRDRRASSSRTAGASSEAGPRASRRRRRNTGD